MRTLLSVILVIPLIAACGSSKDAGSPPDTEATRRVEQARLRTWLVAEEQLRKAMATCTHTSTLAAAGNCISRAAKAFDEKTVLFAEGARESAGVLSGQCGSALRHTADEHEALSALPRRLATALLDQNGTLATREAERLARLAPRARKAVLFAKRACA